MKNVLQVASAHAEWLAHRRVAIAANVANANTPGYGAQDIAPFAAMLDRATVHSAGSPVRSHPRHLAGAAPGQAGVEAVAGQSREMFHSGNSVNIDEEMLKAGQVTQQQSLNAGIVRVFHRLLLTSVKG